MFLLSRIAGMKGKPALAVLLVLLCFLGSNGCTNHAVEVVVLNHPEHVSTEWSTFSFPESFKAKPGRIQELYAAVSAEKQVGELGLRAPDGNTFWPETEIESSDGQWLPLKSRGFGEDGDKAIFFDSALSGNGKKYVAVRLKSVSPITISGLSWYDYDPQDQW
jgi:hypothetical protein